MILIAAVAILAGSGEVGPVPERLHLDPFYQKYIDVDGMAVVGSDKVPDVAFYEVRRVTRKMLSRVPDARQAMIKNNVRIAIMAEKEVTTDIPEHAFLKNDKNTNWDTRARGLGATKQVPVISCAEENVLAYPSDRYHGESILVHEFAHAIMDTGLAYAVEGFTKEVDDCYKKAMDEGLWKDTYAATNVHEYWAEGVQSWFDTNRSADPPNGVHNFVDTREELWQYDPRLAALINRFMPADDWRYVPPAPGWKKGDLGVCGLSRAF